MLAKFSVKKPFTVLVAVIIILVLGVVSYTHMTVDLIPSFNLPYAIVSTTYIGASPEEVEQQVTSPIEQGMASIIMLLKSVQFPTKTFPWSFWNSTKAPIWTQP